MMATRLTSACACSSETPGLRRAYAKFDWLFRFSSVGEGPSGIHTSVLLLTGSWNADGMTPVTI